MDGPIFHVLSRGVDKRKIYLDDFDYLRFIHDLFEFNDKNNVLDVGHYFSSKYRNDSGASSQYLDVRRPDIGRNKKEMLVNVLAFCLMPNHYHLMIQSPAGKTNLSMFMKKINGGYSKYFNNKYERSGTLFQSKYKSIPITNEAHFLHLPYYIHCNPLDLKHPEWRAREMTDYKSAMQFLENYKWSSLPDYLGRKNFPSVTQRDFLESFYGKTSEYRLELKKWLQNFQMERVQSLILE